MSKVLGATKDRVDRLFACALQSFAILEAETLCPIAKEYPARKDPAALTAHGDPLSAGVGPAANRDVVARQWVELS